MAVTPGVCVCVVYHGVQVNSVWFKLYIYHVTGSGPPSLLLVKGTRLRRLPRVFYASISHSVLISTAEALARRSELNG